MSILRNGFSSMRPRIHTPASTGAKSVRQLSNVGLDFEPGPRHLHIRTAGAVSVTIRGSDKGNFALLAIRQCRAELLGCFLLLDVMRCLVHRCEHAWRFHALHPLRSRCRVRWPYRTLRGHGLAQQLWGRPIGMESVLREPIRASAARNTTRSSSGCANYRGKTA
jgi:hypothetical protein